MACRVVFISLLFVLIAAPATAVTINFRHLDTQDWSRQSCLPGLAIRGATEAGGQINTGTGDVAHWRHGGLGVQSTGDSGRRGGSDQIDSHGANDAVVFRFDRAVRLERISFLSRQWIRSRV